VLVISLCEPAIVLSLYLFPTFLSSSLSVRNALWRRDIVAPWRRHGAVITRTDVSLLRRRTVRDCNTGSTKRAHKAIPSVVVHPSAWAVRGRLAMLLRGLRPCVPPGGGGTHTLHCLGSVWSLDRRSGMGEDWMFAVISACRATFARWFTGYCAGALLPARWRHCRCPATGLRHRLHAARSPRACPLPAVPLPRFLHMWNLDFALLRDGLGFPAFCNCLYTCQILPAYLSHPSCTLQHGTCTATTRACPTPRTLPAAGVSLFKDQRFAWQTLYPRTAPHPTHPPHTHRRGRTYGYTSNTARLLDGMRAILKFSASLLRGARAPALCAAGGLLLNRT